MAGARIVDRAFYGDLSMAPTVEVERGRCCGCHGDHHHRWRNCLGSGFPGCCRRAGAAIPAPQALSGMRLAVADR